MKRFREAALAVGLFVAPGCGSDEPAPALTYDEACALVPGCAEPRYDETAPRETIFRVFVTREASGAVRIDEIEEIEVTETVGVPLGNLGGSHLLVGLDDNDVPLDGQVLRFADGLEVMFGDEHDRMHVSLDQDDVSVVGYVRKLDGVETLGLIDDTGALVLEEPAQTKARATDNGSSTDAQEQPLLELSTHCGHIRMLEGEADRGFAQGMAHFRNTELLVPGPTQRAVIEGAFARMTPALCHAVSRIAIGRIEGAEGVGGIVQQVFSGDFVLINTEVGYSEAELAASEEARLRMTHTIVHETTHAFDALLNSEGINLRTYLGEWPIPTRDFAGQTVDHVRTRWGFGFAWRTMHKTFLDAGFASEYGETAGNTEEVRLWNAQQTAESGFMSRYAAKLFHEDIAETSVWTYLGPLYEAAGIENGVRQKEDFGCQRMQMHQTRSVPGNLAAIYTKLMFLKDLGVVHPDDVATCTGANLGLPLDTPGFHIYAGDTALSSFEQGLTASIGTRTDDGALVFEMGGEGEASFGDGRHPATFRLQLDLTQAIPSGEVQRVYDNPPWPRGVYPIELNGTNNFELRLDGAPSGNFDVSDGFVLVAEASNDRIAGSVFIRQVWRLNAPVPVPETYDPPLTVRFLIEN